MLQAIANLGGWLLMMGQHDRSESPFYYFRIEDQAPENHSLRFIVERLGESGFQELAQLGCRLKLRNRI